MIKGNDDDCVWELLMNYLFSIRLESDVFWPKSFITLSFSLVLIRLSVNITSCLADLPVTLKQNGVVVSFDISLT